MKNSNKSAVYFFSLILCLGLSVIINHQISQSKDPSHPHGRNPASLLIGDLRSGSVALERKLAQELAKFRSRNLASIGRPADPIENFRFGVLEGKYALTMNGEKISDISFIDNPNSVSNPTLVVDRIKFLKEYGHLLDAQDQPERVSVNLRGNKIVETYRVRNGRTHIDSYVSFEVDESDHLYGLHTEKVTALKIF